MPGHDSGKKKRWWWCVFSVNSTSSHQSQCPSQGELVFIFLLLPWLWAVSSLREAHHMRSVGWWHGDMGTLLAALSLPCGTRLSHRQFCFGAIMRSNWALAERFLSTP